MKQPLSTVPSLDTDAVQGSVTNGPLHEVSPAEAAGSCRPQVTASSTSLQLLNKGKSLARSKLQTANPC